MRPACSRPYRSPLPSNAEPMKVAGPGRVANGWREMLSAATFTGAPGVASAGPDPPRAAVALGDCARAVAEPARATTTVTAHTANNHSLSLLPHRVPPRVRWATTYDLGRAPSVRERERRLQRRCPAQLAPSGPARARSGRSAPARRALPPRRARRRSRRSGAGASRVSLRPKPSVPSAAPRVARHPARDQVRPRADPVADRHDRAA